MGVGESRAWALVLVLLMLSLAGAHVLSDGAMLVYDEYYYASNCLSQTNELRSALHGEAAEGRLAALGDWGLGLVRSERPPFYFPAILVAGVLDRDWHPDFAILVSSATWLILLFLGLNGLIGILAPDRPEARAVAFAATLFCAQFWDSAVILMGNLPVAGAFTLTLWMALEILRGRGAWTHLFFGLALACGILTKPIFPFFGIPLALLVGGYWILKMLRAPRLELSRRGLVFRLVLMATPPALVSALIFEPLLRTVTELYLMNEELAYYQRGGDWRRRLVWPVTMLTQAYPLLFLLGLAPLWLLSLRRREGRRLALFFLAMLAYVAFLVEQRHARHFEPFFVLLALLAGLGVTALPSQAGRIIARGSALLAIVFAVSGALPLASLNETVFGRRELVRNAGDEGEAWLSFELPPILLSRGDEYSRFRIPEIMEKTGLVDDPNRSLFISFSQPRINWTSFQSRSLFQPTPVVWNRRVHANSFRYGGFGDEGGLSPRFFDANFILLKGGDYVSLRHDVELYHILITENISVAESELWAGLVYRETLETADGDQLFLFERLRLPDAQEWQRIVLWLAEKDPDNPWNARWAHEVLQRADAYDDPAIPETAARWILGFAEDPEQGPRLAARFAYRDSFPTLTASYTAAFKAARDYLKGR
jgi:hypothetical protein